MTTDSYVALITALLTAYFGYKAAGYTNSVEYKLNLSKQRFYDAFLPMFKIIEDTIYQEVPLEKAQHMSAKLRDIAYNHIEMIDPYLFKRISEFNDELSKGTFKHSTYSDICYSVDKEYEYLKKILKLPKRGLFFKYSYKQMPKDSWKEFDTYFKMFLDFLLKAIILILLGIIIYALYDIIHRILDFF